MSAPRQPRPSLRIPAVLTLLLTLLLSPAVAAASRIVLDGPKDLVALMTPHLPEEAPTPQRLLNLVVWAKTNGGMGSLWRSQHELLPVLKLHGGEVFGDLLELRAERRRRGAGRGLDGDEEVGGLFGET